MELQLIQLTLPNSGSRSKIDFISKEQWPPSCPDLYPMDYSVWSILEQKVCASSHANISSFKACLQREWLKIPQDHFRRAVYQFWTRLQAVVSKKGGYIEQQYLILNST
ncbi:hypothetical protein LOD99_10698 [Oopsacas minuta]|uniref:Uncharacterized protein n=1 Tax=Oopsacas minuta TaxID=111878 RepID=A0AAV7KF54_9METZ|nr:hypothetical protein LOD99_10698 [Oopsacas minuta]